MLIMVKLLLHTNRNYSNLLPQNMKNYFEVLNGFDQNHGLLCVLPQVYKTIYLSYFNQKHPCINQISYPYCLYLEAQYLRGSCKFLRRVIQLTNNFEHTLTVGFHNHDHLEFVGIVCQKHLSKTLSKQNSLLFLNRRVCQLTNSAGPLSTSVLLCFS